MFKDRYADVFEGDEYWQAVETSEGEKYAWDERVLILETQAFLIISLMGQLTPLR